MSSSCRQIVISSFFSAPLNLRSLQNFILNSMKMKEVYVIFQFSPFERQEDDCVKVQGDKDKNKNEFSRRLEESTYFH